MKVLVSVVSADEVAACLEGGADVVDVKNVEEGSLGASFPWTVREVVTGARTGRALVSAALGDLPYKPGTASLAAAGLAATGVDFVKAGLHGVGTVGEGVCLMQAVARACREVNAKVKVVAAGYADADRFGGLGTRAVLQAAIESESDVVMLDTAVKDGTSLLDALPASELFEFASGAREAGIGLALAGSLRITDLPELLKLSPDLIGVRTAVCAGRNRAARVETAAVRAFMAAVGDLIFTRAP